MVVGNPLSKSIVDKNDVIEGYQTMQGRGRPPGPLVGSIYKVFCSPVDEMQGRQSCLGLLTDQQPVTLVLLGHPVEPSSESREIHLEEGGQGTIRKIYRLILSVAEVLDCGSLSSLVDYELVLLNEEIPSVWRAGAGTRTSASAGGGR